VVLAADEPRSRGAQLAAVGGCAGCHTRENGPPFAGGVPITTSFGTIYATNITPDNQTGIGNWSTANFVNAMRYGVEPSGRHLYPAFPYDHFTHATDADLDLLYGYLRSVEPVHAAPKDDELAFPFGLRASLAAWNLLYLHPGPVAVDGSQSTEFNRGRYLVESLGHCGGCHTPRGALGAELQDQDLSGAVIEGWYAPPLNAKTPSPVPWTVERLVTYLKYGIAPGHAIAAGPMQDVIVNLSRSSEADLRAIATFLVVSMGPQTDARKARADAALELSKSPLSLRPTASTDRELAAGASIYASTCAQCHDAGRRLSSNSALQLPLAVAVHDADPRSLLRIIRGGVMPSRDERGRWMPGYDGALTDAQLVALAVYLRSAAGQEPPWPDLAEAVKESAE
jgi:mono/diheme cytochrome c family protein